MNNSYKYNVLIVDDDPQAIQVLADILGNCGYDIGFAMNGKQALDYIRIEKPDLILLDVMMPEMDGYETCSILKRDPDFSDIPIIFITAKVETTDVVRGFDVSGVDYILKPFNNNELKSRIKTHLELKRAQDVLKKSFDELRESRNLIEIQNEQLNTALKKFEILSNTDSLTGLLNRRSLIAEMEKYMKKCEDTDTPFSLVMADIDLFKRINDLYGHDAGDYVLTTISNLLSSSVRKSDFLARWGGEEFIIVFANTTVTNAVVLIDRIRRKICDFDFDFQGGATEKMTVTFGVSEFLKGDTLDELIKRADFALYEGKNSGRNTVVSN